MPTAPSELGDTHGMAERVRRPRSGTSAKALLLTILGEFVLPNGGSAWTSTLIDALALLEVTEPNARQATARLSDDGILTAVRHGRATRWELTPRGERLLTSGAQRIYGFGSSADEWDGQWLLVLASIPEEQRAKRLQFRSQLAFAGFGSLSAGVAISPHAERRKDAEAIVTALELEPQALVFVATAGSLVPNTEIIQRAWDLDALSGTYAAFIDEFARLKPATGQGCFASLVRLVHEWRRFPFEDPEIPLELLPTRWRGQRAKSIFDTRRAAWSEPAHTWFRAAEAGDDAPSA
jgi:phenylacetic acid degradation operon negative regulatory protein